MDPKFEKLDFTKEFSKSSPQIIEILKGLLEFNPNFRQTASELLKNPIFDSIRSKKFEQSSTNKIKLDIDAEGEYDYEKCEIVNKQRDDYVQIIMTE